MVIDKDLYQLVTTGKMTSGANWGTGMLIVHPTTGKILLGKRTDNGLMCSPGGKVEVQESPMMGVLRETLEESNIKIHSMKLYDVEMHTAENGKNWTSFMFLSNDFDDSGLQNQVSEVEPWAWYSLDDALKLDLFPPTQKSIERAIEVGLLGEDTDESSDPSHYIPFVECPTSGFGADSCCCAYSWQPQETVFTNSEGLYWD